MWVRVAGEKRKTQMAMKRYASVEDYIAEADQFQEELLKLRKIMLSTPMEETVKWGAPCYVANGMNVVGIAGFKTYVGLWFHQGSLLTDPHGVLLNAQEGKTRGLRQWRFKNKKEILVRQIKPYVLEAIQLAEQGQGIKPQRNKPIVVPDELQAALSKKKKTAKAFEKLTPGKQREYAEYISDAKRDATRLSRIEKIIPMIEAGTGLHDKYKNC